jgi:hypothetical protein
LSASHIFSRNRPVHQTTDVWERQIETVLTNPAGAAVVNAIGPIRQLVRGEDKTPRRYLVIVPGTPDNHGAAIQVQSE